MRKPSIWRAGLVAILVWVCAAWTSADVQLPSVFSDHMVIQQNRPIIVWGKATPGEKVTATLATQQASAVANDAGRFRIELPALSAKAHPEALELVVAGTNTVTLRDVLLGEVWLCGGQSNMRFTVKETGKSDAEIGPTDLPQIRLLYVPDAQSETVEFDTKARWAVCTPKRVMSFTAVGFYFGRELHTTLGVPVGLIDSSRGWSGAESWVPLDVLDKDPLTKPLADHHRELLPKMQQVTDAFNQDLANWKSEQAAATQPTADRPAPATAPSTQPTRPKPRKPWGIDPRIQPAVLYNAMLAPLAPYQLGGVIWYQGETNSVRAAQYKLLLPAVIAQWRLVFEQPDLPFGIVQLPEHRNGGVPNELTWAELRDVQLRTHQSTPHTGIVVTIDIGEKFNIHPVNKIDVGKRLANWALSDVYAKPAFPRCPVYKSAATDGGRIRATFDHASKGLVVRGESLAGFEIAGADRKYVPAQAKIDGDSVVIWSDAVPAPVAARYAWHDVPTPTLFSTDGMPATPFRTDDWPGVTDGVLTVEWQ